MKAIMLAALDEAVRLHVIKLFGVLVTDLADERAVQRFEKGVANGIAAFDKAHAIISECET